MRGVERLAAAVRLGVDEATGLHEQAQIGDAVVHAEAGIASFDVEHLIHIKGSGRVDGAEVDVGAVQRWKGLGGRRHCLLGLGEHLGREGIRHLDTLTQLLEPLGQSRWYFTDDDGPGGHQRTRIRPHSSQRMTASGAACSMLVISAGSKSSRHPVQRPSAISAAPETFRSAIRA